MKPFAILLLVFAAGHVAADAPFPEPAPVRAAARDTDWQPVPRGDNHPTFPATAFPTIKPPDMVADANGVIDFTSYEKGLRKLSPRILGGAITLDATDDESRKLLKSQLYHGSRELHKQGHRPLVCDWHPPTSTRILMCLEDIREAATALSGPDAKALTSWLEELLIVAKDRERFLHARARAGQDPPQIAHRASRYRLKIESLLLKAQASK